MAMAMPIHWRRVGVSCSQTPERSATTTGCVLTRTTDAATVVIDTDVFQLQKCNASIAPAPTPTATSRAVSRAHCRHSPVSASATTMNRREKARRQVAIAIGCACDRRTSGPENETPSSANPRTTGARRSVVGWVMASSSARDRDDDGYRAADDLRQSGHERDPVPLGLAVALGHEHDTARPGLGHLVGEEEVMPHRFELATGLRDVGVILVRLGRRSAGGVDVVIDSLAADVRDGRGRVHRTTNGHRRVERRNGDVVAVAEDEIVRALIAPKSGAE